MMRVAVIGEGQTEYYCLPTIAGRLGNTVLGQAHIRGSNAGFDWDNLIRTRVAPYVHVMAVRRPDKIVIVLDREEREDCAPELAERAMQIIQAECAHYLGQAAVAVIICDRKFECLLFADYEAVESIGILQQMATAAFPPVTDEVNVPALIKPHLQKGKTFNKHRHGKQLAQRMALHEEKVLDRNRSMRKLVKELTPGDPETNLF